MADFWAPPTPNLSERYRLLTEPKAHFIYERISAKRIAAKRTKYLEIQCITGVIQTYTKRIDTRRGDSFCLENFLF